MRILVVGFGFIGTAVARRLHAAGHEVVALTHSPESAAKARPEAPFPVADCDISKSVAVAFLRAERVAEVGRRTAPFEAVLHCASSGRRGADGYREVYLDGCRHLAAAFPEARLVFTSSTSVYPQTSGEWVDEESDADPDRETGRLLRESEEIVLETGGTVARLAGIYGPGRSVLLQRFLEGVAAIDGDPDSRDAAATPGRWINQIHREDAASALCHLLANSDPDAEGGGILNVCDDHPLTQRSLYDALCARFDRPMPPVRPPDTGRKRGWTNKRVANARLRATGWRPRFPSYLDALAEDPDLIPSIVAQVTPPRSE